MQFFEILKANTGFAMGAYTMNTMMFALIGLALFDLALKGWALWRAAKLNKRYWFIGLLLVNSFGILPAIFLFMTNEEYNKKIPLTTR